MVITEWFKVKSDLSMQVLDQARCDMCFTYLDITKAKSIHSGFYVCMAAPYFLPDTNIYSTLLSNGSIEAVINLHVLQPGEVFSALELTRPLVLGQNSCNLSNPRAGNL